MNESFFFEERTKPISITEVNTYLMNYPTHTIRVERARDFEKSRLFYTEHRYPNGLIIYLKWYASSDYLQDEFQNLHLLFMLRNRGHYLQKGFDINLPAKEKTYTQLEYEISAPLEYDDSVYLQLMKDIESAQRFEVFYQAYKQNSSKKT